MALQRLAGLEHGEEFGGVDAQRLEHLGGENLAHGALQGQPAIAGARPGRLARALGGEIKQTPLPVAQLRKQEAAAIADLRVIAAELMPVITHRQWLGEIVRQGFKALEMRDAGVRVERLQPGRAGPAPIPETLDSGRKGGRLDRVGKIGAQGHEARIGRVRRIVRHGDELSTCRAKRKCLSRAAHHRAPARPCRSASGHRAEPRSG